MEGVAAKYSAQTGSSTVATRKSSVILNHGDFLSELQITRAKMELTSDFEVEDICALRTHVTLGDVECICLCRMWNTFLGYHKLMKANTLQKYMTHWKFAVAQMRYVHKLDATTEVVIQRLNFMNALSEFGNLEQMITTEKTEYDAKVYELTHIGGASMLITFWRFRLLRSLSFAFQKWCLGVRHEENIEKLDEMNVALRTGTEELIYRQTKSKNIEETNSRLQLSLLVVLSVLRLRTHSFLMTLYASRVRDAKMRRQLCSDVLLVKDALKRYVAQDMLASTTALDRGKDCNGSLESIQDHILVAIEAHSKLKLACDEINRNQRDLRNTKVMLDRKSGVSSNSIVSSGTGTGSRVRN